MITVYYCKQSENPGSSHRISPAPTITISPEVYYANDSIVGYTYNVTLKGYANALRKDLEPNSTNFGADKTIDHMGYIRTIFNTNGGNLYIKDGNNDIIVAKGATIKNISYETSNNKWVNYSPFTIEIEFNEIDFIGCSNNSEILCNSSLFHTPNQNANTIASDNLVDMKKYKIKSFSDKWSFTIDNQIYESNSVFKVNYTLSATGKNYYIDDQLVPAWQQAKLFVQDRLYNQVFSLLNGVLQISSNNSDGCTPDKTPSTLHSIDNTSPRSSGLLSGFNTFRDTSATYDIYNEQITCDTSESDGSFSVTYNSTIKQYNPALTPVENAALHTYTHNLTVSDGPPQSVNINAQGNIQGLIRGGFIYYNNDYQLPNSGSFITAIDANETKYSNALAFYRAKIGSDTDLYDSTKEILNIKKSQLLIKGADGYPIPSSFSLDHNYNDGTIAYNAAYDKNIAQSFDRGYTNISIVRNDPVEIIQEFVIPGRLNGPIIQKLNMRTARTISITISGASASNRSCAKLSDIDVCNSLPQFNIPDFGTLVEENEAWIKTKEDYSSNKIDGSFSISLEYTCKN